MLQPAQLSVPYWQFSRCKWPRHTVRALIAGLVSVALVLFSTVLSAAFRRSSILMLILSGLVIGALFSALISLVKYAADPQDVLPSITFWMMGTLTGASTKTLLLGTTLYHLRHSDLVVAEMETQCPFLARR